jgi:Aminopeptidase N
MIVIVYLMDRKKRKPYCLFPGYQNRSLYKNKNLDSIYIPRYTVRLSLQIEPEWELDKRFVLEMQQVAMMVDADNTSHPITHKVNTPKEMLEIFDSITYNKGQYY